MQWHQGMLDRSRRRATHRCEARKQHRHGRDMHHKQGGDNHVTDQHGRCCRRHQLAGAVSGHRRRVAAAGKLAVQCTNDNRMPYGFDTHHVVEAEMQFSRACTDEQRVLGTPADHPDADCLHGTSPVFGPAQHVKRHTPADVKSSCILGHGSKKRTFNGPEQVNAEACSFRSRMLRVNAPNPLTTDREARTCL